MLRKKECKFPKVIYKIPAFKLVISIESKRIANGERVITEIPVQSYFLSDCSLTAKKVLPFRTCPSAALCEGCLRTLGKQSPLVCIKG